MLTPVIWILGSLLSSTSLAALEPRYCQDIAEATCGSASELNEYRSRLSKESAEFLNRCIVRAPLQLKMPPRWALQSSASGRELLKSMQNSSKLPFTESDMYDYDQAYVLARLSDEGVREVMEEVLPLMKSSESAFVSRTALHEFNEGVRSDLKFAIELRSDIPVELKAILFARVDRTLIQLPSEYLEEKATQPNQLLNAYRGYHQACGNNGQGMNAFNDGEERVVLCPGLLVAGMVNAKIKRKNLFETLIFPRDRNLTIETTRMRSPEVEAIADCSTETDLMSLYTIVAHELGHSIDGGISMIDDRLDVGTHLINLWACQQKKYPAVISSEQNALVNFQAAIGRNREMTADFWAAQTLSVRLNRTELPRYTQDGFMREMKSNMGIFCVNSFPKGSKSEFEAEMSGHLHGTKRIEAFLEESPELSRALGCERHGKSACRF
jgi:hypothetical protein